MCTASSSSAVRYLAAAICLSKWSPALRAAAMHTAPHRGARSAGNNFDKQMVTARYPTALLEEAISTLHEKWTTTHAWQS